MAVKELGSGRPIFSVIVPAYNVEEYVAETIRSVLCQSESSVEVIVIDDGSTDSTLSVISDLASTDSRLRVFTGENRGLSSTRNQGILLATGRYVLFLDGDDKLKQNALEVCLCSHTESGLDLFCYAATEFGQIESRSLAHNRYCKPDIPGPLSGQQLMLELASSKSYTSSACLYSVDRELLLNHRLRFDDGYIHEDEAFTPKVLACSARSAVTGCPLYMRRIRPGSITMSDKTYANVLGYLQAVDSLGMWVRSHTELSPPVESFFRRRQRTLLRTARKIALNLCMEKTYTSDVSRRFSCLELSRIDIFAPLYVHHPKIYQRFRLLWHVVSGAVLSSSGRRKED
ncbi:glycosyltransferase family 2 protein [Halioglobus sp. HI00S01]|uniref:glycosyltransferase family 2 protein n=1 Tax=Halioglobus sp. HI00S01 TaxID=1822214 RepID=UPI0009EE7C3D